MTIRFLKNYGKYQKGNAYAMGKTKAARFIALGVARPDKMLTNYKVK